VVCLDGTRNEPETGATNVARFFGLCVKDAAQLVYYDPGVGTMGARSATTRVGKSLTRVGGLVLGHGVKENIEEAYRFLMQSYRREDRIFIIGFSRGAYTALALAGMLRTVGLLRPEADNLVPYAMKLYARSGKDDPTEEEEKAFWKVRSDFSSSFGNPAFPNPFAHPQIEFLGIWDAVKTVGWLNWRAKIQQARWPFTRKVPNVAKGRHALAIDEKRRPYREYRFDQHEVHLPGQRLSEMWFAGVHSDVGGTFRDDHKLADIALQWLTDEAVAAGLVVDEARYKKHVGVRRGEELPPEPLGKIRTNGFQWALVGPGWHRRVIYPRDQIHPSVHYRISATKDHSRPYGPKLPPGVT
jgi:uncharacterized protein (DUF2235 family)